GPGRGNDPQLPLLRQLGVALPRRLVEKQAYMARFSTSLPPGPRAPAAWQTIAWMTRPAAFLRNVHARFGDPVTIRTYWTEEPMVLFSHPDAVREIFRLDPAIAPAGQSW